MEKINSVVSKIIKPPSNIVPLKVRKGKRIYKIEFNNLDPLRMDVTNWFMPWWDLQNICYLNEVPVAREINVTVYQNRIYRLTKFIEGERLYKYWNLDEIFIEAGSIIGKINTIEYPKGFFLTNLDFNEFNFIKSDKLYMIDSDGLMAIKKRKIDSSVVRLIRLRAKLNDRQTKYFLYGYAKYRNVDGILAQL